MSYLACLLLVAAVYGQGQGVFPTTSNRCNMAYSGNPCSNSSGILPSWCESENPFLTVLPISDLQYSNKNCWLNDCQKLLPNETSVQYTCEGDDPSSICVAATRISSFQTKTSKIYVSQNTTVPAADNWMPTLFIFGLQSGQVVANYAQQNFTGGYFDPPSRMQSAFVLQLHPSAVKFVATFSVLGKPYLEGFGFILSTSEEYSLIDVFNATAWAPTNIFCYKFQHKSIGETPIQTRWFQSVNNENLVVLAILTRVNGATSSPYVYRITYHYLDVFNPVPLTLDIRQYSVEGVPFYPICPDLSNVTWTVESDQPLTNFSVVEHNVNNDPTNVESSSSTSAQTLISLSSASQVYIYAFETSVTPGSTQTVMFSKNCTTYPACFYSAPAGQQLTSLAIYQDHFVRVANGAPQSSALLWLVLATTGPSPYITTVSLDEFTLSFNLLDYDASDPANRGSNSNWQRCTWQQYWDLVTCAARTAQILPLNGRALDIQVRYRTYPANVADKLKNENFGSLTNTLNQFSNPYGGGSPIHGFMYNVLAVHTRSDTGLVEDVSFFGAREDICTSKGNFFQYMSSVNFIGNIRDIHLAQNSIHLFTAVERTNFDINSNKRLAEVCETVRAMQANLTGPPHYAALYNKTKSPYWDDFYLPFVPVCNAYGNISEPNLNQFAWFVSACFPGTFCPDVSQFNIQAPPDGFYTLRSLEASYCEKGFFCQQGQRLQCPIGHICPDEGMGFPSKCRPNAYNNITCVHSAPSYEAGLTEPAPCPPGQTCLVPYLPGIFSPPGYAVANEDRTQFYECQPGDWCNLGRSVDYDNITHPDLYCPMAFYCETSDVINPVTCPFVVPTNPDDAYVNYCPTGTVNLTLCPAGNYCPLPYEKKACASHRYCRSGSFKERACPGGYYCPTPAEQILCPAGHYCAAGSTEPRYCAFLTSCPAGSVSETNSAVGPILLVLLLGLPMGAWWAYLRVRENRRKLREANRMASRNGSLFEGDASTVEMATLMNNASGQPIKSTSEENRMTIDFDFTDLGLEIKGTGKKVLVGVTGKILHGRVTAVMGPSGAGKSTFLTTLCNKASYGNQTGEIRINGKVQPITNYLKLLGFVPQEDIMHRELTVKEILQFSALTRLPASWSQEQITRRVHTVLDQLGLTEIRHSAIGDENKRGISGGQRKRVNIGMELVADPTVLFLDEPTSGLDSTSSREVCGCLRKVAESGLTIVTVIHQPRYEIFTMFHDVLLLGKGGKTVYLGPSEQALPYFEGLGFKCPEHTNPPDFFMDVISGEVPRQGFPDFKSADLFDLWSEHISTHTIDQTSSVPAVDGDGKRETAGFFKQLWYFTARACVQQTRDWLVIGFDIGLVLIAGLFLGIIYYQQFYIGPEPESIVQQCPKQLLDQDPSPCKLPRSDPLPGEAVMTCLALALASVAGSLRLFGNERTVFFREASTGVNSFAYFIGKQISYLPIQILCPLVYLILWFQLTTPLAHASSFYVIFFLTYWAAAGFGHMVSVLVPPSQAQLCAVLTVLFNMMFSGASPRFTVLKSRFGGVLFYPTYVSYIRWAQEAFYLNEIYYYQDTYSDVQSGMNIYEYKFSDWGVCHAMIFVIGFCARIIAYAGMYFKDRDKKK